MFRTAAAVAPVEDVADPWSDLLPLSLLGLEMDAPDDWRPHLEARGVAVLRDDVGRDAVSRSDARVLLAEYRDMVAREREAVARHRERVDREAEERDRAWRSELWGGLSAEHLPIDVAPAAAMLQAAADARPKRVSVLQEALSNSGEVTFHSLAPAGDESWPPPLLSVCRVHW